MIHRLAVFHNSNDGSLDLMLAQFINLLMSGFALTLCFHFRSYRLYLDPGQWAGEVDVQVKFILGIDFFTLWVFEQYLVFTACKGLQGTFKVAVIDISLYLNVLCMTVRDTHVSIKCE